MRSEEQRVEEIGIILFCLTVQSTESKMLPDGFCYFYNNDFQYPQRQKIILNQGIFKLQCSRHIQLPLIIFVSWLLIRLYNGKLWNSNLINDKFKIQQQYILLFNLLRNLILLMMLSQLASFMRMKKALEHGGKTQRKLW